jgi:hypothetical protein
MLPNLHTLWEAWREALAAHRYYEHQRSRGVPHDMALKEAVGFDLTPARQSEIPQSLCFAGKA